MPEPSATAGRARRFWASSGSPSMRFGMWAGWKAPQLPAHQFDFLLLLDDDPFGEASKHGVAAELQLGLRHVDRTLVVRNHHRREVAVRISGVRDRHIPVHAGHGLG